MAVEQEESVEIMGDLTKPTIWMKMAGKPARISRMR